MLGTSNFSPPLPLLFPFSRGSILTTGRSGLIAYRELTKDGFDVHIFERDTLPGGNWYYTEEIPLDAPIPNANITVADYEPSLPPDGVSLPYVEVQTDRAQAAFYRRAHRAPKPVWYGLRSNAPAVSIIPFLRRVESKRSFVTCSLCNR